MPPFPRRRRLDDTEVGTEDCEVPEEGCVNGLFSFSECKCECIPPYCPYEFQGGQCLLPSGCDNPWDNCTRGRDCPWWPNPLKAETCTTGPVVPGETWDIWHDEDGCCLANFPESPVCGGVTIREPDPPTKYPTIAAVVEDYEVVKIKFDLENVPEEVTSWDLRDVVMAVLDTMIGQIAKELKELEVVRIEPRFDPVRDLRKKDKNKGQVGNETEAVERGKIETELVVEEGGNETELVVEEGGNETQAERLPGAPRAITLNFDIFVVRDRDIKFGPLIIEALKERYDEMGKWVAKFVGDTLPEGSEGVNFNLCAMKGGEFDLCVRELPKTYPPFAAPPGGVGAGGGGAFSASFSGGKSSAGYGGKSGAGYGGKSSASAGGRTEELAPWAKAVAVLGSVAGVAIISYTFVLVRRMVQRRKNPPSEEKKSEENVSNALAIVPFEDNCGSDDENSDGGIVTVHSKTESMKSYGHFTINTCASSRSSLRLLNEGSVRGNGSIASSRSSLRLLNDGSVRGNGSTASSRSSLRLLNDGSVRGNGSTASSKRLAIERGSWRATAESTAMPSQGQFTINTHGGSSSKRSTRAARSSVPARSGRDPDPEMMYSPDKNKPDPESDILLITTGSRRSLRSSSRRHGYGDSSSFASSKRSRRTMGGSEGVDSGIDETSGYDLTCDPEYYGFVPTNGGGRDALGYSDVLSRHSSASGGELD